jgi:hypothetical protein
MGATPYELLEACDDDRGLALRRLPRAPGGGLAAEPLSEDEMVPTPAVPFEDGRDVPGRRHLRVGGEGSGPSRESRTGARP